MLLIVMFVYVERLCCEGCVQEEGGGRLSPSSTNVAGCGQVETVELEHGNAVCLCGC